jgi:hypothetical protein
VVPSPSLFPSGEIGFDRPVSQVAPDSSSIPSRPSLLFPHRGCRHWCLIRLLAPFIHCYSGSQWVASTHYYLIHSVALSVRWWIVVPNVLCSCAEGINHYCDFCIDSFTFSTSVPHFVNVPEMCPHGRALFLAVCPMSTCLAKCSTLYDFSSKITCKSGILSTWDRLF